MLFPNNDLQAFSSRSPPALLESADGKLAEVRQASPEETSHFPTAAGFDYIRSLWLALHNTEEDLLKYFKPW